jgi:chemotaxis protein MotA
MNQSVAKESFMIGQIIFSVSFLAAIFFLAFTLKIEGMGFISNMNALMIIVGGTFFATFMIYPWRQLSGAIQVFKNAVGSQKAMNSIIQSIVNLARSYRKGWGIRDMEDQANHLPPGLLKTGMEMIAYNYSRDKIQQILQQKVSGTYSQYELAEKMLQNMARLALSLGMVGMVVNMIRVFEYVNNFQVFIVYMALPFLSLFYGLILGNLCLIPFRNKLRDFMTQEKLRLEIIQEGILSLYDQEHPRIIQYKLETLQTKMEILSRTPITPKVELLSPHEVNSEVKRMEPILNN